MKRCRDKKGAKPDWPDMAVSSEKACSALARLLRGEVQPKLARSAAAALPGDSSGALLLRASRKERRGVMSTSAMLGRGMWILLIPEYACPWPATCAKGVLILASSWA